MSFVFWKFDSVMHKYLLKKKFKFGVFPTEKVTGCSDRFHTYNTIMLCLSHCSIKKSHSCWVFITRVQQLWRIFNCRLLLIISKCPQAEFSTDLFPLRCVCVVCLKYALNERCVYVCYFLPEVCECTSPLTNGREVYVCVRGLSCRSLLCSTLICWCLTFQSSFHGFQEPPMNEPVIIFAALFFF